LARTFDHAAVKADRANDKIDLGLGGLPRDDAGLTPGYGRRSKRAESAGLLRDQTSQVFMVGWQATLVL